LQSQPDFNDTENSMGSYADREELARILDGVRGGQIKSLGSAGLAARPAVKGGLLFATDASSVWIGSSVWHEIIACQFVFLSERLARSLGLRVARDRNCINCF